MKIIVIIGIGRAGIELLQSLFDNHSQILQMPGIIRFDKKFKNTLKFNSLLFINTFIKNNKHFFDSRLQKSERHNQLGFNKKQYYLVSKNIFKKKFLAFYKKKIIMKLIK